MDGGTYRQAPYESIDADTYSQLLDKMPDTIDWEKMTENTDNVEGAQTLACTAGGCEI
jgi:ribonucleoside-diphosphate reductase alpha chain